MDAQVDIGDAVAVALVKYYQSVVKSKADGEGDDDDDVDDESEEDDAGACRDALSPSDEDLGASRPRGDQCWICNWILTSDGAGDMVRRDLSFRWADREFSHCSEIWTPLRLLLRSCIRYSWDWSSIASQITCS